MSKELTHIDEHGAARIVDVSNKPETSRVAVASGFVRMDKETLSKITSGKATKGDVLAVARLAGIQGAKQAGNWIPLCHPLRLTGIDVSFVSDETLPGVRITAEVRAVDRTGVEMEAMTAVSASALTIYDMCKAVDRSMTLGEIRLESKQGGRSGDWRRPGNIR